MTIEYMSNNPINIGDYIYGIYASENFRAYEPCHICDGTKKVIIKNQEFDCPNCSTRYNNDTHMYANIHHFIIRKFKIYEIKYSIDQNTYEPKYNKSEIIFAAFSKYKNNEPYIALDKTLTTQFRPDRLIADKFNNFNEIHEFFKIKHMPDINQHPYDFDYNHFLFKDYKTAVLIAEEFNKKEQEKLSDFNKTHDTNYKTEFKTTNDKPIKSK